MFEDTQVRYRPWMWITVAVVLVGSGALTPSARADWENVGTAGFSAGGAYSVSLAFHNGEPYVAFQDGASGYMLTVMRFTGGSWQTVGAAGFSAGQVSGVSLAFNSGEPYVAYGDGGNSWKITVMRYTGGSWQAVGTAGFSAGGVGYLSLAFESGEPYVVYQDYANSYKATVMRYTGGSWQTVGTAGFSADLATSLSLAFESGEPYVAYSDKLNGWKATVMRYTGGSWQTVGAAGFSAGSVGSTSLAFHNGEPYMSYSDGANASKATVVRYTGGSWQTVGTAGFSAGIASNTSLAFYNGEPYVAYIDGGNSWKATVMRYTGGSWQTVGAAGFSAGTAGGMSLAFINGEPHVAYEDGANGSKATVMRYSAPPTTQATDVTFSSVGAASATIDWTRGNGNTCAAFVTQASSGSAAPANNTTYTANTSFGAGTQIGATGWYCVYNGSGTSVTVTGLSPGTTYRVMVCEYDGAAGNEQYLTDTAAGNPANVTTAAAPGITVTPTSGLVTTEAGGTDTFDVVLDSQPTANVTIGLSSSDTTEGMVSPTSLTFTSANWDTPQTVTATGVDDNVNDGDIAYTVVTAAAASADGNYNGLNASDVSVTNSDNDTAGITVNPTSGLVTTEAGGTAQFTIVLDSQPSANVTVALSSSDLTEGIVAPASVTLTSGNWNTPQTVTVTGRNDVLVDGNIGYSIVTAAAVSADADFDGLNASDVSVTNSDDDTAGITVNPTSGLVTTETGGTVQFTVVLNTQPTANVTIGLSSSDTTEGAVSPASLTFTSVNWSTPQTATVTGVDDDVDDGNIPYTVVTAAATSGDGNYSGLDASDVSFTNTDDDTAGITVNPTSGLVTTEAGGTDTFDVVLNSQPTANVTIGLSSSDTTEGTVSPASVTFTSANWNTPQTVTVTGVDDDVDDGNIAYTVVAAAATSGDANYNNLNVSDVSVTNTDDDAAGITVAPTSGLITTEAGGTDAFDVVLDSQPTANVAIGLSSSDTTEGTVSPASLTFTSANWDTPQTITVTGVDDALDDGNVAYTIVTAAATSADGNYNGVNASDVSVTNTDDDVTSPPVNQPPKSPPAGITVNPTSGLATTEAGRTAQFTIVLDSHPSANVTVALSSSDLTEGTVAPASVTLTSGNWNTPQTVTVTGMDDSLVDGNIVYSIATAAAVSSDANYDGLKASDVSMTNSDNDMAGITVNPTGGLVTTEAAGTAQFTVVLDTQPTANVTISLSSSNTAEGTVSPASLTFTTANWNVAQAVTATGVDDVVVDGNVAYTIVTAAATSADRAYNGQNASDVSVTNSDDDAAGITVDPTGGLITTEAGGANTFDVVLDAQPTANVTIGLSSSDTTEGAVSPASLTFTSANWSTPQTVTVTGVADDVDDGNVAYTIVTAAATSADANYNGLNASEVSVTNTDDDTAGITVALTGGVDTSGTNFRDDADGTSPEEDQSRHHQFPLPCGAGSLGSSLVTALLLQLGGARSKRRT